jgi:hypothetical protein
MVSNGLPWKITFSWALRSGFTAALGARTGRQWRLQQCSREVAKRHRAVALAQWSHDAGVSDERMGPVPVYSIVVLSSGLGTKYCHLWQRYLAWASDIVASDNRRARSPLDLSLGAFRTLDQRDHLFALTQRRRPNYRTRSTVRRTSVEVRPPDPSQSRGFFTAFRSQNRRRSCSRGSDAPAAGTWIIAGVASSSAAHSRARGAVTHHPFGS